MAGGEVVPIMAAVPNEPFPLTSRGFSERPGSVKGAPLLGAAQRTLDGEDRSEMISRGKGGRRSGKKGSAKMAPSATATNSVDRWY